jgi:hypothetical protein
MYVWTIGRRSAIGLAMAGIMVSAGPSAAQARARAPEGDAPNQMERGLEQLRRLKEAGVTLKAGWIVAGSGLGFGLQLRRDSLFGSPVGASSNAMWSVRGYQEYDLKVGVIREDDERVELRQLDMDAASTIGDGGVATPGASAYLHARQRVYPRVDFFGMGQNTTPEGRSDYKLSGPSVDLVVQWQRTRRVGVSGRVGVVDLDVAAGSNDAAPDTEALYADAGVPGLDRQRRYVAVGGAAVVDRRDRPALPAGGTFASVALWHAAPLGPASGSFTRLVADTRHFRALGRRRGIVAARLLFSTRVGAGAPTPFYLQPTLGGSRTLRGFRSYRLRGDTVWAATVEYRWRVHKYVDVVPFVDAGGVAARVSQLAGRRAEVTPGVGVRGRSESRVIGRMDYAYGRDGHRLLVALSAPF